MAKPGCLALVPTVAGLSDSFEKLPPTYIWLAPMKAAYGPSLVSAWAVNVGSINDQPFPPARNPWNTAYQPGGSSSGSGAAVAGALCMGAMGSDTGGSIRNPAGFCGTAGIKPTYGLVSRCGIYPLSFSLDTAGPLTWTVEDSALMLDVLAGHDPNDQASARAPPRRCPSSSRA